jgi:hypothetical protein
MDEGNGLSSSSPVSRVLEEGGVVSQAGTRIWFEPVKRIDAEGNEYPAADGETYVLQFTGKQLPSGDPIISKHIHAVKGDPGSGDALFVPAIDLLTAAAEIEDE